MSSLDFVWNNSPVTTGKVFARKRVNKIEKNDGPKRSPTQLLIKNNIKKTSIQSKSDEGLESRNDITTLEGESNRHYVQPPQSLDNNRLIKRKGKKDKQNAKALRESGESHTTKERSTDRKVYSLFTDKHKQSTINTNIPGVSLVEKVFSSNKSFKHLDIHKHIVSNLEKNNFVNLTNVQEKSIPAILTGKNVLIRSQTGSGKTLAYAVPILDGLQGILPRIQRNAGVQAIIVVPTRELALQTHEIFGKINTFQWIICGYLCGGENRNTEKTRLRKGIHILIATPGRLLDHLLHTEAFNISNVRCLVLDEADRLLDMGFKKEIVKIVEELDKSVDTTGYNPMAMLKGNKPETIHVVKEENPGNSFSLRSPASKVRQTLLLSATLTKGIAELADFTMKDHTYVDGLDETSALHLDYMVIPNTVKQEFILTSVKCRLITLSAIIAAKSKQNAKIFVFMATSQMVDFHHELFTEYFKKMSVNRGKLKSGDVLLLDDFSDDSDEEEIQIVLDTEFFKLHGSMEQSKRKEVFKGFRAAKRGVLLCTDVAGRGVDVPEADCIIQYTGPQSDEDYLHRVGRTGRAGKSGSALIFLTHEEQDFVTRLQKHKVFLKEHLVNDFMKHLCDLMDEPDSEKAANALQQRFEKAVEQNRDLHKMACFAYSSWSRFYNTYPSKLRSIFDFKQVNLGHYVTSFAIRDTPTAVSKIVRGQVSTVEPRRLNKKLATHDDNERHKPTQKRKIKSISLTTSEFSSGMETKKKKKRKTA